MIDEKPKTALTECWQEYFPLPHIRPKQEKALDFIARMMDQGIKDIVIAAPTGTGKTAIGATVGFWAGQPEFPGQHAAGAYYLCTQKLLQDQLANDIDKFPAHLQSATSLKTASEYECPKYHDCGTGSKHKPCCRLIPAKTCIYKKQVTAFMASDLAITNYPYFFTERTYAKNFPSRKVLVCDECHTLENQLLKFVELIIGTPEIDKFLPPIKEVPRLPTPIAFLDWLNDAWLPGILRYLDAFANDPDLSPARAKLYDEMQAHVGRLKMAINGMETEPENWVYWQETDPKSNTLVSIAKPLSAAGYFKDLISETADTRIYMSAYTGSKDIFCRTLGLNSTETAMISLGSIFPRENRLIHATLVGSMSKTNQAISLPRFLRVLDQIMTGHGDEKGIIHCNSYALGTAIFEAFKNKPNGLRMLFPTSADKRENVYKQHRDSGKPTVILSPSFTEGFDFADDAARWQVIAKIPFPYLGDKQVSAKKDTDPDWYAQKTVEKIIQACGRIVRNETDHGITYITDSDFDMLWSRYSHFFPPWWKEALVWH